MVYAEGHYPLLTSIWQLRDLGPSNSQKNTACQVPRTGEPSRTMSNSLAPTSVDLTCASEFPSACLYPASAGTSFSRAAVMSLETSGSSFSLIVTAAVVWGMKTWHRPFRTPLSDIVLLTSDVMSTNSFRFPVRTPIVCTVRAPPRLDSCLWGLGRPSRKYLSSIFLSDHTIHRG